jgi:hypothetical protein
MKNSSELPAKVKELMNASSVNAELKALCGRWLKAQGTADEKKLNAELLAKVKEDIVPIDNLIAFAESPAAAAHLGGKEKADGLAAAARKAKSEGRKWCICPACQACAEILEHEDWLK